jgi:DNA-binding beta-propeller fold protein YncE
VDFARNVYVASFYSNTVSRIDTSGNITVIAGTGAGGLSGVGGPATSATFDRPSDVVVDPAACSHWTLAGATALTGCSGTKTGFAVPTSTSIITVTGTSGSITHSTAVTLIVQ